ncbi:MAG: DUF1343 domain-containing protein [Elusimicrobia bacterium]|nr:DUF1343 domain-containing protein [Elusimicrobiota bacterium]
MNGAAAALLGLLALAGPARAEGPAVLSGLDVLADKGFADFKGKRVGLITNQTGRDRSGRTTVQVLANATDVTLSAMFSPEHGFTGVVEDTAVVSGTFALPDGRTIPLYSLYGATRAPTAAMLKDLDVLVFDIQDIGARFYTYSTTMAMAMEAAAAAGIDFVVLDRPNPINGETVEGPVLSTGIRSFIAYLPVPVRHGMTMGELARLHNITSSLGAKLTVVPLKGWRRAMWYDQTGLPWTRPSPNMPDLASAALYPGIACFEASSLSVGRGTEAPFQWVGAPGLKAEAVVAKLNAARLPGIEFRAEQASPSKPPFAGEKVPGVRMRVNDRDAVRPLAVFAHLAAALRDQGGPAFSFDMERLLLFVGMPRFAELYLSGAAAPELEKSLQEGAAAFKTGRAVFLLY